MSTDTEILVVTPLPLDCLHPAEDNPRTDLGELEEMAASMRRVGVLQPLVVAPIDGETDRFRIVAGHRRYAAASLAELEKVPAIIRHDLAGIDERQESMLVENLHRKDLTPLERGRGFQQLAERGRSQKEIAERTGVSQATVSKSIAVLKLPEQAQAWVEAGELPLDDGAKIAGLSKAIRDDLFENCDDPESAELFLRSIEAERQAEADRAAKEKELVDQGVRILSDLAAVRAAKAKPLSALYWVKKPAHRKEPCRAVMVEVRASYRGAEVVVTEFCTKPRAHPQPNSAGSTRPGAREITRDPVLELHIAALNEAAERRHEWMAGHLPDVLTVLHGQLDRFTTNDELLDILGIEVPGDEDDEEYYEHAEKALLAYADTVEKAGQVLWIAGLLLADRHLVIDPESSYHVPKSMAEFKVKFGEDRVKELLDKITEAGYEPTWVELKRAGMPFTMPEPGEDVAKSNGRLGKGLGEIIDGAPDAPAVFANGNGAGPTETGAAAPTQSSTDVETVPDRQTAGDWPCRIEPKGKKFQPICRDHGYLGTGNTTEDFAQETIDKHLAQEHAEPSGWVTVVVSLEDRVSKPWLAVCAEHGEVGSFDEADPAHERAQAHIDTKHGAAGSIVEAGAVTPPPATVGAD